MGNFEEASQKYKAGERSEEITKEILKFYKEKEGQYVFDDDINHNYIRIRAEWALKQMNEFRFNTGNHDPSVLDLGSWTGAIPNYYFENGFKNLTCLEICDEACKMASNIYPHLTYVNKSVEEFDPATTYDIILGFELLEHVTSPVEFIKKYKDLLNPSGVLLLTLPTPDKVFSNPNDHEHINKITEEELSKDGFDVDTLTIYDKPVEDYNVYHQMTWLAGTFYNK